MKALECHLVLPCPISNILHATNSLVRFEDLFHFSGSK
uniref:Uncharacterized protein n=1 Tax=Arundo donax TaxID=35708 RepID=A0A0A9EDD2_ARUDO